MNNKLIVGIDFDGTCTTHDYPLIGKDIGAVPVLKKLVEHGHKLMLWTMRGNKPGSTTLEDAVNWFKKNEIELWGINENPDQQAAGWFNGHKQLADVYVDDMALGAPIKFDLEFHPRPFIDWIIADKMFEKMGLYEENSLDIEFKKTLEN